jgi:hypothetical protein
VRRRLAHGRLGFTRTGNNSGPTRRWVNRIVVIQRRDTVFEVPELRIQQVEGRYVAVLGDAEIPLPSPGRLKQEAVDVCRSAADDEAAEALAACDLSYAVAQGEGIEQLIEVVIAAPDGVFELLHDHRSPVAPGIMGALLEVCPNLGSDRVVRKP